MEKCRRDPKHFIFTYCVSEDQQDTLNPHKLIPRKPHLETCVDFWFKHKRLAVPKSRQMTCSWIFTALYFWEARFFKSRNTFFSSQMEEDSAALIDRVDFMDKNLPKFFHQENKSTKTYCHIQFANRSHLIGVAQGANAFRGYTLSGLLIDEGAFQDELPSMIKAAIPAIGLNGRITILSSAAPSAFSQYVFDEV